MHVLALLYSILFVGAIFCRMYGWFYYHSLVKSGRAPQTRWITLRIMKRGIESARNPEDARAMTKARQCYIVGSLVLAFCSVILALLICDVIPSF